MVAISIGIEDTKGIHSILVVCGLGIDSIDCPPRKSYGLLSETTLFSQATNPR